VAAQGYGGMLWGKGFGWVGKRVTGWVVLVRGPGMIEAVRTTASPAAIWAIVIVAVVCLAIWLGAVAWADMHPIWRHHQEPEMPGSVLGGVHRAAGGRSVAPDRNEPAIETGELAQVPAQRGMEPESATAAAAAEQRAAAYGPGAAREPVLPARRQAAADQPQPAATTQAGGTPEMPAQRTGDADRPEQSTAGPSSTERRGG